MSFQRAKVIWHLKVLPKKKESSVTLKQEYQKKGARNFPTVTLLSPLLTKLKKKAQISHSVIPCRSLGYDKFSIILLPVKVNLTPSRPTFLGNKYRATNTFRVAHHICRPFLYHYHCPYPTIHPPISSVLCIATANGALLTPFVTGCNITCLLWLAFITLFFTLFAIKQFSPLILFISILPFNFCPKTSHIILVELLLSLLLRLQPP
ncbi:hypothetical protein G9A89_022295 [Geosiphon pyriformis]|nr:hypothetical protein G9A89_022295 [Geosiphon pyriformis]